MYMYMTFVFVKIVDVRLVALVPPGIPCCARFNCVGVRNTYTMGKVWS